MKKNIDLIRFRFFVIFFLILFIISFSSITFFKNLERNRQIEITKKSSLNQIEYQKELIMNHLDSIQSDLFFLPNINDFLSYQKSHNESDRIKIENEFLQFIKSKKVYDQIRYIDENGDEIVRVNYNYGHPVIVEKSQLQNKKDRYYFSKSISVGIDEVYNSPFDLNVENNKIELPIKPMIRFGTPVYNTTMKNKGIIIFNYLGNIILDDLQRATIDELGKFSLLNNDGYWIYDNNSQKEWGFMYSERKDINFNIQSPKLFENISNSEQNQIVADNVIYTSIRIRPYSENLNNRENSWILLNTIIYEDLEIKWSQIFFQIRFIIIFLFFLDISIAYVISGIIRQKNIMIYERLQAEEKLKFSEERNLAYLENSPACTKIVDLDFNLQYMSRAGIDGLNIENIEDHYGKPYPFYFSSETFQNSMTSSLKKAKNTVDIITLEALASDINGKELWFHSTIIPVSDNKGILDYIMIVSIDITKRKRAEVKQKESEARLRDMVEQAPYGIALIDPITGQLLEVNTILSEIIGYTKEELLSLDWIKLTHPDDIKPTLDIINPLLLGQRSRSSLIKRYIHKNGSIVWIELTITPINTKNNGNPTHLAILKNITKQKCAEDEKAKLQKQIYHNSKMEALGQLAGGMAHDFNNMLSGIMSSAQLLLSPKRNLDDKNKKYVNIILQASKRAAKSISNLLLFGRKENLTSNIVDLHRIIEETVSITNYTIDKKIVISNKNNAQNCHVLGDSSKLQNVLLNLCINASHAMTGGGEIHIITDDIDINQSYCETSSFDIKPGKYCKISVSDSGTGIQSEILNKIFDPFFTTKEQGMGTGLGLAAVFGTIVDHEGEILVDSEVGFGTTFTMSIPCSQTSIKLEKEQSPILIGSGTILFVDDEDINRIVGKDILESLGYKVLLAEDGLESIDIFKIKHSQIDIVLMDMIMPKISGTEAFYKMKEIDENCKVIISSGFNKNEDIEEILRNGLASFIHKPYTISEISHVLGETLKMNS
ncbi:MAG: PAS domain S-box protein [Spirochaetaceae bacterium]